ncbi:MAG: LicD family protein [Candidatus Lokiarchaeia archaeon]
MDEKVAIEALREVKEILDKHGIEYWLDYGTLLGAVRDRRFIPWDTDIDLGVWSKDIDKLIKAYEEFHTKGYLVHSFVRKYIHIFKVSSTKKPPTKISFNIYDIDKRGATIRFFINNYFMYFAWATEYILWIISAPNNIGDNPEPIPYILHRILIKVSQLIFPWLRQRLMDIIERLAIKLGCENIQVIIPIQYFTNLSKIKFYSMEFNTPSPVEEYLAYRYGENWKIPKKDYVYYKEDGAIVKNK